MELRSKSPFSTHGASSGNQCKQIIGRPSKLQLTHNTYRQGVTLQSLQFFVRSGRQATDLPTGA